MTKAGSRSLKAALQEAGLSDRASDETQPMRRRAAVGPGKAHAARAITRDGVTRDAMPEETALPAPSTAVSPSLTLFKDLIGKPAPTVATPSGVVSPPPWLRAAKRGRRRAQMMNAFGWVMTLVVAGTIIGVAGRYLAVPPAGIGSMQARQ